MRPISNFVRAVARRLPVVLVALAMIGSAHALAEKAPLKTSFGTDFSDIWWVPIEAGWGIQLVQTGSFIFATLFVYGPDGKATWFVANLNPTAANTFSGALYAVTGPYFGGPFDPAAVMARVAGTMTFQGTTPDTGLLSYTADGVVVNKSIQRQPLTLDDYNGAYASVATQTSTNCTNPANNVTSTNTQIVQVTQNAQLMAMVMQNPGGSSCSLNGTYTQLGKNGRFDGNYICSTGDVGMFSIFEMNNHVRQFNARTAFQSTNNGCLTTGRVTGVIPN